MDELDGPGGPWRLRGGVAGRERLDAAARAYLAGQDWRAELKRPSDDFESGIDYLVAQRAIELEEQRDENLAARISRIFQA